ncbi:MAG: histidine phosphatase family protein, partial [Peptostreptococcaceae bacterium]
VRDRMVRTCTEIMEKDDHDTVLAVSHGGACYHFLRAWQDPSEELKKGFPNCCIFKYEYENNQFNLVDVIRQEK